MSKLLVTCLSAICAAGGWAGTDTNWAASHSVKQNTGSDHSGRTCVQELKVSPQTLIKVCRDSADGLAVWMFSEVADSATHAPTRLLPLRNAAGAKLSWYEGPGCGKPSACIQGVLLVEPFDDYCLGSTVLVADSKKQFTIAGRIPEVVEIDGEARCVGSVLTLAGPAEHAELKMSQPLLRQTRNGKFVPVSPPVSYLLVKGKLLRK